MNLTPLDASCKWTHAVFVVCDCLFQLAQRAQGSFMMQHAKTLTFMNILHIEGLRHSNA